MIQKSIQIALILLLICVSSCKKDSRRMEAEKIVAEWMGKEIVFPKDVRCTYMGKDTVCPEVNTPYKILVYTDSIGCTSCKLRLYEWAALLKEVEQLNKISFLFYFHPKDGKELQSLLKRDNFRQMIFEDYNDELNRLNKFPNKIEYQCFLLNEKNQVVVVGNPTINPKLWDIYKQIITGKVIQHDNIELTTIEVKQTEIELEELCVHETATEIFVLRNIGDTPLLINDISSSCGCTVPEWEKRPISPGDSTEIKIKVTPDASGFFRKSIKVSCNIEGTIIQLVVRGMIKEQIY